MGKNAADLPRTDSTGRERYWSFLWLALIAASGLLTFDPKLYVNGDNVDYIRLAEAVRHGHLWASAKYPPLFPWLLVFPQILFGTALLPQKVFVFLFFLGSGYLLLRRARLQFPKWWGEPIVWIAMTILAVLEYGHYVMSEIPYFFFSLVALEAADRMGHGPRRWAIVAAIAAAATFYTRSVGLSLWVAAALVILLHRNLRRRERWLFVGLSVILILPWGLRTVLGPPNPYFRQLIQVNPFYPEWGLLDGPGWLRRIGENARIYLLGEIPTSLFPGIFRWTYDPPEMRYHFLPWFLAWIPLAFVTIGLLQSIRRTEAVGLYLAFYLILNILWPSLWTGLRFLVPVLPLLSLLLFRGVLRLSSVLKSWIPRHGRLAPIFLAVWILLSIRHQTIMAREVQRYPPVWDAYFKAAEWIRTHTSEPDLIVDRKAAMLAYVTGRRVIGFPRESDPGKMIAWMAEQGVDYVVVPAIPYDDVRRYLIPAVQAEQYHFAPVYEVEEPYTVVLRFVP